MTFLTFLAALSLSGPIDVILWLIAAAIGAYIIYYALGQSNIPEPIKTPVYLLILLIVVIVVLKILGVF